jgi:hypothetical protein
MFPSLIATPEDPVLAVVAWVGLFAAGLVYANLAEWLVHRYVMHGEAWLRLRWVWHRLNGDLPETARSFSQWRFGEMGKAIPWREANTNIRRHMAHHGAAKNNGYVDADFARPASERRHQRYETRNTLALAFGHFPLAWLIHPAFFVAIVVDFAYVVYLHKRSHLDPAWAQTHLAWHVDHHMGAEPDANFCFTWPLWDILLGTRRKG